MISRVVSILIVIIALGAGCSGDLSRQQAEELIQSRFSETVSASFSEDTYKVQLWPARLTFDPEKDMARARRTGKRPEAEETP